MQKPQGWPVADVRKFIEAALANFRILPPSGAPKPRKAEFSAFPSASLLGSARANASPKSSPQIGPVSSKAGFCDAIPADEKVQQELLKFMDDSAQPIFIKDGLGHYLYRNSYVLEATTFLPYLHVLQRRNAAHHWTHPRTRDWPFQRAA
jgi:hypothetical protein